MICFSVVHGTNYQLPTITCRVCKKKYHSACLVSEVLFCDLVECLRMFSMFLNVFKVANDIFSLAYAWSYVEER